MLGLTVQNFVSAATGMAVLVALIRGLARKTAATIGNFWVDLTRSTLYILLPLSLVLARGAGVAGRRADVRAVQDGRAGPADRGRGRASRDRADARPRPGRVADRDQAARHQRRRVLRRQLGAPVREPDAAQQLPRDAGDPADPGGALLHVRPDGRRHAAGLGGAGGDDADLRAAGGRCTSRPSRRAIRRSPLGVDQAATRSRRQHGGQGGALRHRQLRALGDGDDRRVATARSTRCTTRTRRSAA